MRFKVFSIPMLIAGLLALVIESKVATAAPAAKKRRVLAIELLKDLRFGWEPTFTNKEILDVDVDIKDRRGVTVDWQTQTEQNAKYRDLLKEYIEKKCPKCVITRTANKHGSFGWKVTYPDGLSYKITPDPSVVEIIVSGISDREYERGMTRLQKHVFDGSRAVGMQPHISEGQGHITLFTDAFKDPRFLRNFIVDMANHPELGLGIFDNNVIDSPPVGASRDTARAFANVIDRFDRGEITGTRGLVDAIGTEVYVPFYRDQHDTDGADHEQALRLYELHNPKKSARRLEVRTFRPQKDMKEFMQQIKLLKARMHYVAQYDGLIPYQSIAKPQVAEAKKNFKKFVTEAGLAWNEYKSFIPPEWKLRANQARDCRSVFQNYGQHDLVFR